MFVALGFLIASFLVVLLTPAYRSRTVRLTSERIRAQLPTTEAELKADKDRVRADSALRIHRLETERDRLKFDAARQLVEVSRRDGAINSLKGEVDQLRGELEAAHNARNVLEQTVADRLPKVEQRLIEAKKLLFQRDREIANITQDAERTQRALVEAVQINTQQRAEIDRLNMVVETRVAQNRDGLADPTFDAEVALRSEIEALRARTRDQAALLDKLGAAPATGEGEAAEQIPEVVRLQRDLMRAEPSLKEPAAIVDDVASRQREQKIEDQAREIARLTAELAAYQQDAAGGDQAAGSIKDSRIAMKARLASLTSQVESQDETIRKLRAEVAGSNERLARQAQHFMEEMRRLGAGTLPASAQTRKPVSAAARRSLKQKIVEAKPELAHGAAPVISRPVLVKSDPAPAPETAPAAVAATAAAVSPSAAEAVAEARPAVAARPRLMDRISDYNKN